MATLRLLFVASTLVFSCLGITSRAYARGPSAEDAWLERVADGDIDLNDALAMPTLRASPRADARGPWISIDVFRTQSLSGNTEVGAMATVGFAFDRVRASRSHTTILAEPPVAPRAVEVRSGPVAPRFARTCVSAAWRAAGLGSDDARLDGMASRARLSAMMPEVRLRGARNVDDRAYVDTQTDAQRFRDSSAATMTLEARLTWRLDRVVYADDEPSLERMRMDRLDARTRLAGRVLELLFQWQRARYDAETLDLGSRDQAIAVFRVGEAEAALDVVTGGWFTAQAAK